VQRDWPKKNRYALQEQVNILFGWKPVNMTNWLTNNPNGPDQEVQEQNLR
jgi:hypothetical protein